MSAERSPVGRKGQPRPNGRRAYRPDRLRDGDRGGIGTASRGVAAAARSGWFRTRRASLGRFRRAKSGGRCRCRLGSSSCDRSGQRTRRRIRCRPVRRCAKALVRSRWRHPARASKAPARSVDKRGERAAAQRRCGSGLQRMLRVRPSVGGLIGSPRLLRLGVT
jgi:hypothetical protein